MIEFQFSFSIEKEVFLAPMFQLILTRTEKILLKNNQLEILFIEHYKRVV